MYEVLSDEEMSIKKTNLFSNTIFTVRKLEFKKETKDTWYGKKTRKKMERKPEKDLSEQNKR